MHSPVGLACSRSISLPAPQASQGHVPALGGRILFLCPHCCAWHRRPSLLVRSTSSKVHSCTVTHGRLHRTKKQTAHCKPKQEHCQVCTSALPLCTRLPRNLRSNTLCNLKVAALLAVRNRRRQSCQRCGVECEIHTTVNVCTCTCFSMITSRYTQVQHRGNSRGSHGATNKRKEIDHLIASRCCLFALSLPESGKLVMLLYASQTPQVVNR